MTLGFLFDFLALRISSLRCFERSRWFGSDLESIFGGAHSDAVHFCGAIAILFFALDLLLSLDFFDRVVELHDFFLRERSVASLGQGSQPQRSDGKSTQRNNFVAQSCENTPNFAVLAFAQGDFDFGAALSNTSNLGTVNACEPLRQVDTALQASHRVHLDLPSHDDVVTLGDTVTRVSQPLCELAIVCQ